MKTTYFNIDAKRILIYEEAGARQAAGGGAESACYMVIPRRRGDAPAKGGKVLDFAACRRALEEGGEPVPDPEEIMPREKARRPAQTPLLLEWAASAAVIGAAVAAMIMFLR